MKTFILSIIIAQTISLEALAQIPYPELIERIKPSVVGIEAHDDTLIITQKGDSLNFHSYGSGAIIGLDNNIYALTNEHVIAIKDTAGKTIRYAKKIIVSINVKDVGAFPCEGKIIKLSEELDLAALRIFGPSEIIQRVLTTVISKNLWEQESNLREGEIILYAGYPLMIGRGLVNYPLSRSGIISQLLPDEKNFLIDAFIQPGYSGSPVFVLRRKPNIIPAQWDFKFIGICKAYPYSYSPVYKKVNYQPISDISIRENPGFSVVVGVTALKKLFELE